MTTEDRAREILRYVEYLKGEEALDYVRSQLAAAHSEGVNSGLERARQAINSMFGDS